MASKSVKIIDFGASNHALNMYA